MNQTVTLSNPPRHRPLVLEYRFETDDIAFVCLYTTRRGRNQHIIHDYYVPKQYRVYLNKKFGSSHVTPLVELDEDDGPPGWMIDGWNWDDGDDPNFISEVFADDILKHWRIRRTYHMMDENGSEFTRVHFVRTLQSDDTQRRLF
jgi:hypothetical protein